MYAQYSCGSGKASIHDVDNCDNGYYVVFVDSDGQCEIDDGSIYQTLEYAVENAAILAEGESKKVFVCWGGDTEKCPEKPPTRNIGPTKVVNDDKTPPTLTAADHTVVFENESQARQVLETAKAYKRTAILVQNLEGKTYIVGVFKSKKDAIEAKKSVAGVGKVFDIIVQPSGYTNKAVSFYNVIMLAHAISGEKHDKLVTCDHPYWCDGAKGKIYAKIETTESQPVIQEIPESQEVVEIADKPIEHLPESVQVYGVVNPDLKYSQPNAGKIHLFEINAPRKVELAPFNALISIESAQDIVRLASENPMYAVVVSIDDVSRIDYADPSIIYAKEVAREDEPELSEVCKLIEIRKDETFVFEELDCEAVTYVATVDAQSIMHPNGRWKIYFHDERPDDANDCSAFEFNGWDLNGDEYRIESGFGDSDENRDERIIWRIYAKDIEWDGKTRDLVCICRHPDALPEDDMGYKRPPVNPHSVPLIAIPWLATENENEEYEYVY